MRIAIVGTTGSGKTTLAAKLATEHNLTHIELDVLNWQPDGRSLVADDPDAFILSVEQLIAADNWICDGNYSLVRDQIWRRATHLVWLDYSKPLIMRRVIVRSIRRSRDNTRLWNGNRESWSRMLSAEHPVRWAWSTWSSRRARYARALEGGRYPNMKIYRITSPRQAEIRLSALKLSYL